jgi:hypothetical protein
LTQLANNEEPVELTVPRGELASSAMRVLVGWVASCNDLPLDQLDDIDLALETLLAGEPDHGGPLTLRASVRGGMATLVLQGLSNPSLRSNLVAHDPFTPTSTWPLDVRLFLSALVDEYALSDCASGGYSVSLRKRIG